MASVLGVDLVDVTIGQARRFDQRARWLGAGRPVVMAAGRLPMAFIQRMLAWLLNRVAKDLAARAIYFEGAQAALQRSPAAQELDPGDGLRVRLDEMERSLLHMREQVIGLLKRLEAENGHRRTAFRESLRYVAAAGAELYENVRNFKAALQAHDADAYAKTAAPRVAATDDELKAQFDLLVR